MRLAKLGYIIINQIPAYESDGYSKRSGLTQSDFIVETFHDGEVVSLPVTITEIASTGEYRVSYAPTDVGYWLIDILINFNKAVWRLDVVINNSDIDSVKSQVDKIDLSATIGPATSESGSLVDRLMNKNSNKTYNQGTDSLEALRDRLG